MPAICTTIVHCSLCPSVEGASDRVTCPRLQLCGNAGHILWCLRVRDWFSEALIAITFKRQSNLIKFPWQTWPKFKLQEPSWSCLWGRSCSLVIDHSVSMSDACSLKARFRTLETHGKGLQIRSSKDTSFSGFEAILSGCCFRFVCHITSNSSCKASTCISVSTKGSKGLSHSPMWPLCCRPLGQHSSVQQLSDLSLGSLCQAWPAHRLGTFTKHTNLRAYLIDQAAAGTSPCITLWLKNFDLLFGGCSVTAAIADAINITTQCNGFLGKPYVAFAQVVLLLKPRPHHGLQPHCHLLPLQPAEPRPYNLNGDCCMLPFLLFLSGFLGPWGLLGIQRNFWLYLLRGLILSRLNFCLHLLFLLNILSPIDLTGLESCPTSLNQPCCAALMQELLPLKATSHHGLQPHCHLLPLQPAEPRPYNLNGDCCMLPFLLFLSGFLGPWGLLGIQRNFWLYLLRGLILSRLNFCLHLLFLLNILSPIDLTGLESCPTSLNQPCCAALLQELLPLKAASHHGLQPHCHLLPLQPAEPRPYNLNGDCCMLPFLLFLSGFLGPWGLLGIQRNFWLYLLRGLFLSRLNFCLHLLCLLNILSPIDLTGLESCPTSLNQPCCAALMQELLPLKATSHHGLQPHCNFLPLQPAEPRPYNLNGDCCMLLCLQLFSCFSSCFSGLESCPTSLNQPCCAALMQELLPLKATSHHGLQPHCHLLPLQPAEPRPYNLNGDCCMLPFLLFLFGFLGPWGLLGIQQNFWLYLLHFFTHSPRGFVGGTSRLQDLALTLHLGRKESTTRTKCSGKGLASMARGEDMWRLWHCQLLINLLI